MRGVACKLGCLLAALAAVVPAVAGAFPTSEAGQGIGRPTIASITLQILPSEGGLVVTQAVAVSGMPGAVRYRLPLLLPESGPQPLMGEGGVRARGGEGTRVAVTAAGVEMSGMLRQGRQLVAEVSYQIPVASSGLVLSATADVPLVETTVITRRDRDYGLHVRPLMPFTYREEDGEDGTWAFQTATTDVAPGTSLRVAVGHLPLASGPYRAAALIVAALILFGLGFSLLARRRA